MRTHMRTVTGRVAGALVRQALPSGVSRGSSRTAAEASSTARRHTKLLENRGRLALQGQVYKQTRSLSSQRRGVRMSAGVQEREAAPASTAAQLNWKPGAEIRMLYDGDCPLCMREVNMLRRRDEGKGKIDFVDIASPDYSPEQNAGLSFEQAMGEIHAILPDGSVVTNIEVFRRLYEAVGLGWVYAATKVKPIGAAADWLYGIWAKWRLPITGRPDLATVLAEKKMCGK